MVKNGHDFTHSLCPVTRLIYVPPPQLCTLKPGELHGQMAGQVHLWTVINLLHVQLGCVRVLHEQLQI